MPPAKSVAARFNERDDFCARGRFTIRQACARSDRFFVIEYAAGTRLSKRFVERECWRMNGFSMYLRVLFLSLQGKRFSLLEEFEDVSFLQELMLF